MDNITRESQDIMINQLNFGLPETAQYITNRRQVNYFVQYIEIIMIVNILFLDQRSAKRVSHNGHRPLLLVASGASQPPPQCYPWHAAAGVQQQSSWPGWSTCCILGRRSCDVPLHDPGAFCCGDLATTGDERALYWVWGMAIWEKNSHPHAYGGEPYPTKVPHFHLLASPVSQIRESNQTPIQPLAHCVPHGPTSPQSGWSPNSSWPEISGPLLHKEETW